MVYTRVFHGCLVQVDIIGKKPVPSIMFSNSCMTLLFILCILLLKSTNTKSLAKEFSKILIFEYFGHLKTGFDVFFDADSESPRMT